MLPAIPLNLHQTMATKTIHLLLALWMVIRLLFCRQPNLPYIVSGQRLIGDAFHNSARYMRCSQTRYKIPGLIACVADYCVCLLLLFLLILKRRRGRVVRAPGLEIGWWWVQVPFSTLSCSCFSVGPSSTPRSCLQTANWSFSSQLGFSTFLWV